MSSKSHAETKTLKVGDTAPDFTLKTGDRKDWHLSDFRELYSVPALLLSFLQINKKEQIL